MRKKKKIVIKCVGSIKLIFKYIKKRKIIYPTTNSDGIYAKNKFCDEIFKSHFTYEQQNYAEKLVLSKNS